MGDLDNRTNHNLFAHHDRLWNTSADLIYRPYFRHHYVGQRESGTAAMAAPAAGIDEAAAGGFSAEILTAAPAEAAPAEAAPTATPTATPTAQSISAPTDFATSLAAQRTTCHHSAASSPTTSCCILALIHTCCSTGSRIAGLEDSHIRLSYWKHGTSQGGFG